jgi:histidinol dehydrogenase
VSPRLTQIIHKLPPLAQLGNTPERNFSNIFYTQAYLDKAERVTYNAITMSKLTIVSDALAFIKSTHEQNQSQDLTDIHNTLTDIEKNVKAKGDTAVIDYTKKFDNLSNDTFSLIATQDEIKTSYDKVPSSFIEAVKTAKENITEYHNELLPKNWHKAPREGVEYGVQYNPITTAGLYVPGGRAPYPSTVLMDAIPAKIAGVETLVMTTPPQPDGSIPPQILVAADICEVDIVVKAGGAQAIFALAHGTESIPKVDKIVGPGNIFVDLAKQRVYGTVDIDKPAGPSDVTVYIEDEKYAAYAASELLAQLEHDPNSIAIGISPNKATLEAIQTEFDAQLNTLTRKDIIEESVKNSGLILLTPNQDPVDMINASAPEHLVLIVDNYEPLLKDIKHAGSIFCGPYTPVALGDYYAGPNHVLPTSGAARFASPLGVMDFMKYSSYMSYTKDALKKADAHVKSLTEMEGFDAHYNSVHQRTQTETQ